MTTSVRMAVLLVLAAHALVSYAKSDAFPYRLIRLVVPLAPGCSVDLLAVGTEFVARPAPDGYTLLVNTLLSVVGTHRFARLPYERDREMVRAGRGKGMRAGQATPPWCTGRQAV